MLNLKINKRKQDVKIGFPLIGFLVFKNELDLAQLIYTKYSLICCGHIQCQALVSLVSIRLMPQFDVEVKHRILSLIHDRQMFTTYIGLGSLSTLNSSLDHILLEIRVACPIESHLERRRILGHLLSGRKLALPLAQFGNCPRSRSRREAPKFQKRSSR